MDSLQNNYCDGVHIICMNKMIYVCSFLLHNFHLSLSHDSTIQTGWQLLTAPLALTKCSITCKVGGERRKLDRDNGPCLIKDDLLPLIVQSHAPTLLSHYMHTYITCIIVHVAFTREKAYRITSHCFFFAAFYCISGHSTEPPR